MRRGQCALTIASLLVARLPASGCQRMGRQHPLGESVVSVPPVDPGGGDGDIGPDGPPDGGDDDQGGGGGGGGGDDLQAPVPEPATLMLLGGGIAGVALLRRRRRNR